MGNLENLEQYNFLDFIEPIQADAHRVVETQNKSFTRNLVDSAQEHDILENLLEKSKPSLPKEHECSDLDFLFFTPFRYPPLKYGSRFGKITERSLWYGSLELETALTEVAYYRFVFKLGIKEPLGNISVWLTSFVAEISTNQGLDLTQFPYAQYRNLISSPTHYQYSQSVASQMREHNVEAFLYFSARRQGDNINIGLFSPTPFKNKKRKKNSEMRWQCITTDTTVEFYMESSQKTKPLCFQIEDFFVNHTFPDLHF